MNKSQLLFLFGCLPVRILLVYFAKVVSQLTKTLISYFALLVGVGFIYIYLTGSRKTGPETFGKPIWWNNWRPIHAGLYLAFAYSALQGYSYAWKYLATDVVVGIVAFLTHYYF